MGRWTPDADFARAGWEGWERDRPDDATDWPQSPDVPERCAVPCLLIRHALQVEDRQGLMAIEWRYNILHLPNCKPVRTVRVP